jgi:arylsulfatase A-like enzyme
VSVALSLEADRAGTVGFWGAPVVRASAPPRPGRPRGVILVQADTLRRDHLEAYGHGRPTAPGLARLAKEGVRFQHAFAQASWTKVSSTSILTSLYPPTHGVLEFNDRLPVSATTIAEVYREHGYATLSLSSVPFTGQFTNLQQGFEELRETPALLSRGAYPSKTARESVDRLLRWLEERRDAPFFVYLHVFDPHSPYEPYAPYDRLWVDGERRARHLGQKAEAVKRIRDPFIRTRELPNRREVAEAGFDPEAYIRVEQDWYDASIRAMDVELSRLLDRLRALGRGEDTVVLVTSDHGTEFHEHGEVFHGQGVYGELTNIPLIVSWPGQIARDRVVEDVVQSIDVMPTLLDLSGLPVPREAQGRSLRPFLEAAPPSSAFRAEWSARPAVSHRVPNVPNQPPPRDRVVEAIWDGPWKLLRSHTPGYPEFELYAWKTDPLDQKDVASANPEVVTRLARALDAWRATAEGARLRSDEESTKDLDPEALERLRALGYVR